MGSPGSLEDALASVRKLVDDHESFLVLEHVKPDGDCIGSGLALVLALRALGKKALLVSHDPHPSVYSFLPGQEYHSQAQNALGQGHEFDVAIFVDCTDSERAGDGLRLAEGKIWCNIDHHISNDRFGAVNLVDPQASAAGELVYLLLLDLGVPLTSDIATCLYVAIATDTGGFRYQNTNARTFAIASELTRAGVIPWEVAQAVFETRTGPSVLLLGNVLSTLQFSMGGRIAWISLTREMMEATGATVGDTEGIIAYPSTISGVEVALFFREIEDGSGCHVSFRSRSEVDVSEIAVSLGGGGHPRAAGAQLEGTLPQVTQRILGILHGLPLWTDS